MSVVKFTGSKGSGASTGSGDGLFLGVPTRPNAESPEVIKEYAWQLFEKMVASSAGGLVIPGSKDVSPAKATALANDMRLQLEKVLTECAGDIDGFDVVLRLCRSYKWQGNENLVLIVANSKVALQYIVDDFVRKWVLSEGIRINVKVGDVINYKTESGFKKSGTVINLFRDKAMCQVTSGKRENNSVTNVFAENIIYATVKGLSTVVPFKRAMVGFTVDPEGKIETNDLMIENINNTVLVDDPLMEAMPYESNIDPDDNGPRAA